MGKFSWMNSVEKEGGSLVDGEGSKGEEGGIVPLNDSFFLSVQVGFSFSGDWATCFPLCRVPLLTLKIANRLN